MGRCRCPRHSGRQPLDRDHAGSFVAPCHRQCDQNPDRSHPPLGVANRKAVPRSSAAHWRRPGSRAAPHSSIANPRSMLQRQRIDSGITHLNIGPCEDPADRRVTIIGRPGARGVQCESRVAAHLLGPSRCCLTHVGSSPAFCGTGLRPSSRKPALRAYGFHYVDPPFFSLPAANGRLLEVRQQQDHPRRWHE